MERKELDWPIRSIRMPDELWYYFAEQAAKNKVSTSEFIRQVLIDRRTMINKIPPQSIDYLKLVHKTNNTYKCPECIDFRRRGLQKRGYGAYIHRILSKEDNDRIRNS